MAKLRRDHPRERKGEIGRERYRWDPHLAAKLRERFFFGETRRCERSTAVARAPRCGNGGALLGHERRRLLP